MHRRTTPILLLVVALLVAGCAGAVDDGPSDADAPAASDGADTPTPAGPVYELPLDGATIATAHEQTLASAGSFTVETNVTVESTDDGGFSVQTTSAVDRERGTMLVRGTTGEIAGQTTYVAPDGTAYQRLETATGEAHYQQMADAPAVSGYFELPVTDLVDQATFTYVGRSQVAGVSVAVYEVTDLEELVAPGQVSGTDTGSLQAFEVRMAISDDGLIRQFHYHVETEIDDTSRTITTSILFRDVGTTTVEPPDWLDEAKASG